MKGFDRKREPRGAFFIVSPEQAGSAQRERPEGEVNFVFDKWLGDDLVSAHPSFLGTNSLKQALESLENVTGFRPSRARTSCSAFLKRHSPGLELPCFWVLHVDGRAGADDMGVTRDGSLVVSQRTMDVLVRHQVGRAVFSVYGRGGLPLPPEAAGPHLTDRE